MTATSMIAEGVAVQMSKSGVCTLLILGSDGCSLPVSWSQYSLKPTYGHMPKISTKLYAWRTTYPTDFRLLSA